MVQDLTNPMLAQIPHVLLGAHAGTIMGVESNGMQFYPEASVRLQFVKLRFILEFIQEAKGCWI